MSWGRALPCPDPGTFFTWLRSHFNEGQRLVGNLSTLINVGLPAAFGEDGVPGNAEAIIDTARKVVEVRRRMIEWSLDLRRVSAGDLFGPVLALCERFFRDAITSISDTSEKLKRSLQEALADNTSTSRVIDITLTVAVPPGLVDELQRELAALGIRLGA
jgi:hypothetical protein